LIPKQTILTVALNHCILPDNGVAANGEITYSNVRRFRASSLRYDGSVGDWSDARAGHPE